MVHSPEHLTEFQQFGARLLEHEVHAKILPDRLLIQDVLGCEGGRWVEVSAADFEAWKSEFSSR